MSPRTAEQAAANACRTYDQLVREANAGRNVNAGVIAAKFRNAALLAIVLEDRQTHLAVAELRAEQHRTNELLTQLIGALAARHSDFRDDETGAPLPAGVEGYGVPR